MQAVRRCSIARLTFQRLLCGDKLLPHDNVAVHEAAVMFRARYPIAPFPVLIAAALGKSHILQGEPRRAVALLASHPSSDAVADELKGLLLQDASVEADALLQLVDVARLVSSDLSCRFLCAFADRLTSEGKAHEVKQRFLRELQGAPRLLGTFLRPLMLVSDPANAEDRRNAVTTLGIALKRSFVSPEDYGQVLSLLSRGGDHRKVLALWSWMRHSSARWDRTAVSATIISASLARKMDVAIAAIQSLAEANEDPTIEAQKYFIRYLASRFPPLSRYADQLVAHWHTDTRLWTTGARVVGVELLFVHYHGKDYGRLRECLLVANKAASTTEEKQDILKVGGMAYILRHFAADIGEEEWLQDFYISGMQIINLGEYPQLLALLASFARHTNEKEKFVSAIRGLKMSSEAFEEMATFIADDVCFKNAEETLRFINNIAEALSQQVPTSVSGWLQLLEQ